MIVGGHDLRTMGLTQVTDVAPVRTDEMPLLDGTFAAAALGVSARRWKAWPSMALVSRTKRAGNCSGALLRPKPPTRDV